MEKAGKNPFEIFRATPADAEELLPLQKLAFETEAKLYGPDIPAMRQSMASLLEDIAGKCVLKAVDAASGKIAGTARASLNAQGVCKVGTMAVHPAFRRRGIASKLLKRIELEFPEATRFELFTGERSYGNIAMYEKAGYREWKRGVLGGVPFVFLRLERAKA